MNIKKLINPILFTICAAIGIFAGDYLTKEVVLWSFFDQFEAPRTGRPGATKEGLYVCHDFLDKNRISKGQKVLLMGDSTNDSVPDSDKDRRFISDMVKDSLKGEDFDIYAVSYPGLGIDRALTLFRYFLSSHPDIRYAIFPVPLRWLSPIWRGKGSDRIPRGYELYGAKTRIWPWLTEPSYDTYEYQKRGRPEPIPTVVGDISLKKIRKGVDYYVKLHKISEKEAVKRVYADQIAMGFGFELTEDDPLLKISSRIQYFCDQNNVDCTFYVAPMNIPGFYQLQPKVAKQVEDNMKVLVSYFKKENLKLIDISTDLPPARFTHVINEHVDEIGRRFIAKTIVDALRTTANGAK